MFYRVIYMVVSLKEELVVSQWVKAWAGVIWARDKRKVEEKDSGADLCQCAYRFKST